MGNYRDALLLAAEDLGPSGTKTIDIDLDQPISRLEIKFLTTKSKGSMDAPGPANITKIELVDGSQVLHSLSGYENQALAYYNRGAIAMEHGQHNSGSSEEDHYAIDFGRYLWDPALAFLPGNFRNPQLKLTFDEDVADTGVTVNECEVLARIFDEKTVSPIGFLRAIEEYSYTLGADNSYEVIKLSSDYVIRQLLVRAYQDGYEPWYSIDEARLDENNLQRIPFDHDNLENYYRRMKDVWTPIQTMIMGIASAAGRVFYVPQTDYWATMALINQGNAADAYLDGSSMKGGKPTIISAAASQFLGIVHGYLPWHCFQFPMGKQDDLDDWYNPAEKSPRLRLRASTGATSSTGQVVLEQLRPY